MKGECLYYKRQYYDVGTKVKIKTRYKGEVITTFKGRGEYEGLNKLDYYFSMPTEYYIVEIIEPVYYKEPEIDHSKKSSIFTRTGSGSWQSSNEVIIGLIWYIIVMIVGTIFIDRWLIWIGATIFFFVWKHKK